MSFLLDTNVVSELIIREPNPGVVSWIEAQSEERLFLSVITIGELARGIERLPVSRRRRRLAEWLDDELVDRFSGRILTVDVETMRTWGAMTARAELAGRALPAIDSLIAAIALQHDLALVTRNTRDFEGTELRVINPWL